jgi:hypothetical protein
VTEQTLCAYGCGLVATHRVRRDSPIVTLSENIVSVCDEHMRDELRSGSSHVEWIDKPRIVGGES